MTLFPIYILIVALTRAMKARQRIPGKSVKCIRKDFFYFYFLKVNISFFMHDTYLRLYIYIKNIAAEFLFCIKSKLKPKIKI